MMSLCRRFSSGCARALKKRCTWVGTWLSTCWPASLAACLRRFRSWMIPSTGVTCSQMQHLLQSPSEVGTTFPVGNLLHAARSSHKMQHALVHTDSSAVLSSLLSICLQQVYFSEARSRTLRTEGAPQCHRQRSPALGASAMPAALQSHRTGHRHALSSLHPSTCTRATASLQPKSQTPQFVVPQDGTSRQVWRTKQTLFNHVRE